VPNEKYGACLLFTSSHVERVRYLSKTKGYSLH